MSRAWRWIKRTWKRYDDRCDDLGFDGVAIVFGVLFLGSLLVMR